MRLLGGRVAILGKVLVIGGGVAGMSCAIELRKSGVGVVLIDSDPDWRAAGAGITLTGPSLRALKALDVLDEVKAQGAAWSAPARVMNPAGELLQEVPVPQLAPDIPGTGGIMRPLLHKILSTRVRDLGAEVVLGVTITGLKQHGDHVEAQLSDGSSARYDLVIGADGISSSTRGRLFPDAPKPFFTGQVIYRMVAERPAGFDRTHFFMSGDIKLGFNPVSPTQMYMFLLYIDRARTHVDPKDMPRLLHEKMAGFGLFVPEIRETVLTTNAHTVNYTVLDAFLLPQPWHAGRVLLVGDAAHATTPHLASGAGMAIEDGIVLAEELNRGGDVDAVLARYMERRFERCRHVIDNSVKLGQIEMGEGSPADYGRLMSEALTVLRQPI